MEGFDAADGQRRLQVDEFHDFAVPVCLRRFKHGIAEPEHNLALGKGCIGSAFQEFIIELDKIAGEPVDVLVNGKFVAKGEVVVIEESFGIRITEIIN